MKKVLVMTLVMFFAVAGVVFACEPPEICPEPYKAEVEGGAFSDAFKKAGDNNTGSLGEVDGGSRYSAKGTETAIGSADSSGNVITESIKNATNFISKSASTLRDDATAEGVIGPGVVHEDGYVRQASWGDIGDVNNYAIGSEETKAEERGNKTNPAGSVSIWGEIKTEGETQGILNSGENFRESIISNKGRSLADGSNSDLSNVSGAGIIGAGSTLEKGASSGYAYVNGKWCYVGNVAGEGFGDGKTRTDIIETTTTLGVKSHSGGITKAKTTIYD